MEIIFLFIAGETPSWFYHTDTDTWSQGLDVPPATKRERGVIRISPIELLLFGGWEDEGITFESHIYNTVEETWTPTNDIPAGWD